jgi:hypothetical protein
MKDLKNQVTVILDTTQENSIQIGKPQIAPPSSMLEVYNTMLLDTATLCEAIIVLINEQSNMGLKSKESALQACIHHITQGVNDPSLRTDSLTKFAAGIN